MRHLRRNLRCCFYAEPLNMSRSFLGITLAFLTCTSHVLLMPLLAVYVELNTRFPVRLEVKPSLLLQLQVHVAKHRWLRHLAHRRLGPGWIAGSFAPRSKCTEPLLDSTPPPPVGGLEEKNVDTAGTRPWLRNEGQGLLLAPQEGLDSLPHSHNAGTDSSTHGIWSLDYALTTREVQYVLVGVILST